MESACETCSYFQTTIEFRPTLQRQRDHAQEHGQPERAAIFDKLIQQSAQCLRRRAGVDLLVAAVFRTNSLLS